MNDKELLGLAAKAAGINLWWDGDSPKEIVHQWSGNPEDDGEERDSPWNPLTDDGDALRLAVSLKMEVYHGWDGGHAAYASVPQEDSRPEFCVEPHMSDHCAATRRAITRAAAEVGRKM